MSKLSPELSAAVVLLRSMGWRVEPPLSDRPPDPKPGQTWQWQDRARKKNILIRQIFIDCVKQNKSYPTSFIVKYSWNWWDEIENKEVRRHAEKSLGKFRTWAALMNASLVQP